MSGLKPWFELEPGGVVVRDRAVQPLTGEWRTGLRPEADLDACVDCLLCWLYCPDSAVELDGTAFAGFDLDHCKGCELCAAVCPTGAIEMVPDGSTDLARAQLLTGGEAIVEAMCQVDPDVVPVYPITPQTPIIQSYAKALADGRAHGEIDRRRVRALGDERRRSPPPLAGARTMTATSSQGLALMAEIVYIAASMRAPVVMALGNRALSGPINIHCDHSDSMLIRDSGAIQLFAENAQEAYDLTVLAPRLAEHPEVLLPVIVCVDGFTITHSAEPVEPARRRRTCAPSSASTGSRTPSSTSRSPTTQGPFAMPDYYYELRRGQAAAIEDALEVFERARRRADETSPAADVRRRRGLPARRRRARARLPRLDRRHREGRGRRAARRGRGGRPAADLLVPAVPGRRDPARRSPASTRSSCSTAPTRPGGAPPLVVEIAAALGRPGSAATSTGSAGATSTRPIIRAVFAATAPQYVGLRGEPCPA